MLTVTEQSKDQTLMDIKFGLENGKLPKSLKKKHVIIDNILYFISDVYFDPILRLYIPEHLRDAVIRQYHDINGHIGSYKLYYAIRM